MSTTLYKPNIFKFILIEKTYKNNHCDYVPVNISDIPRWLKEDNLSQIRKGVNYVEFKR